jgi:hypothetical protein
VNSAKNIRQDFAVRRVLLQFDQVAVETVEVFGTLD